MVNLKINCFGFLVRKYQLIPPLRDILRAEAEELLWKLFAVSCGEDIAKDGVGWPKFDQCRMKTERSGSGMPGEQGRSR